ncbi:MAG: aminomethyl-transferring glycine dehydrogenase subunit GcvPA [marine benthic group bacterium]|jgi:glycine dehydrogenase subunit 1|nr:aminomethyl-transferring glycine dehydrogenase subunit GcvPA [Gemmatimonadota bacterium]MCL7956959.1 aminomethyl-transferring glycine dehydrogenase subunit GcvPA [Gemmatimonadota bacterium]MCL7963832.1 aminomethyl-transferring glycine dehydrogenase subunit GcvPA [Gemmatimonadota bacterium]MCL7966853.1 aminomethyl-transferring glycine dehydrogenase subunit GcvPA [Gemmatimonadota bacterium]MCL7970329.1 aminomethyl-transferring glycine dehydrogenase subunit GcvPA [Gemmatimonadota bacterium]
MSFVPHSDADRRDMLAKIGVSNIRELYSDIPDSLVRDGLPEMPDALSEWETVKAIQELADRNHSLICFAGAGQYDHFVPAAVDHLIRRSEFYTAYTPYQPEVSQGTLQVIYEFQTMVCELTGMDVANASMYDGPSSAAEAAVMARAVTRRDRVLAAGSLHPHYRKVTETYLHGQGSELQTVPIDDRGLVDRDALASALGDDVACVIVQYPNFFGVIEELEPLAEMVADAGALFVVAADPVTLSLLRPPGECGADIVVAEGQPFGNPLSFGGPVVGLFAAKQKYVRKMPGRIVGATEDVEGRRGYVLTLQTREQQIRRDKATSNICTNQGLNALAATIHLSLLGRAGLRKVAEVSTRNAHYARSRLEAIEGVELLYPDSPFVREFAIRTEENSRAILERGFSAGVLAGVSLSRFPSLGAPDGLLLAFTEKRSREEIDRLIDVIAG